MACPNIRLLKNLLSSQLLWEAIKDIPTVGVIRSDPQKHTYDIAWPMGVVAALTPSTNPTSTTMYKTLISVKAQECDRRRAASVCGKMLCGDHPHHGRSRGAGWDAKGIDHLHEQESLCLARRN